MGTFIAIFPDTVSSISESGEQELSHHIGFRKSAICVVLMTDSALKKNSVSVLFINLVLFAKAVVM